MNNNTTICPTCGHKTGRADGIIKGAVTGVIIGIIAGIIFGIWFSIWWFGTGMHFTPMSLIHYFAWGLLFGFVGAVIGIIIKVIKR